MGKRRTKNVSIAEIPSIAEHFNRRDSFQTVAYRIGGSGTLFLPSGVRIAEMWSRESVLGSRESEMGNRKSIAFHSSFFIFHYSFFTFPKRFCRLQNQIKYTDP